MEWLAGPDLLGAGPICEEESAAPLAVRFTSPRRQPRWRWPLRVASCCARVGGRGGSAGARPHRGLGARAAVARVRASLLTCSGLSAGSRLGRREAVDGARRFSNQRVQVDSEGAAGE